MAKQTVLGFEITPLREKTGIGGRKLSEDQLLRMEVPGGNVLLRKSTLEAAGDSWDRLKARLLRLSEERGIPFADGTEETE